MVSDDDNRQTDRETSTSVEASLRDDLISKVYESNGKRKVVRTYLLKMQHTHLHLYFCFSSYLDRNRRGEPRQALPWGLTMNHGHQPLYLASIVNICFRFFNNEIIQIGL